MFTVVPGDTLSGIAQRFHVAGGRQTLYQRNRDTIADDAPAAELEDGALASHVERG